MKSRGRSLEALRFTLYPGLGFGFVLFVGLCDFPPAEGTGSAEGPAVVCGQFSRSSARVSPPSCPLQPGRSLEGHPAPPWGTLNGKGDTEQCRPRVSSECARHLDPPKGHSEQPQEHRQSPRQRTRGPLPATPLKSEASHLGPPRGPASQEDSPSPARGLFAAKGRELATE